MNESEKCDAHVHIWDWTSLAHRDWLADRSELHRSFLPTDLHTCFAEAGVDQGVLVEAEKSTYSLSIWWLEVTEYCADLKNTVLGCDLEHDNIHLWLDAFSQWAGFKGMRAELAVNTEGWLQNPALLRSLRLLQQEGISLDVETSIEGLRGIDALAEHHPDLSFIVNHAACPPAAGEDLTGWIQDLEVLAGRPNVFVKTSDRALGGDDAGRKHILGLLMDVIGPHRVMWGSGWPFLRADVTYAEALASMELALSDFSSETQASVLGGNARRVYRLI